jgi:ubiquinone/menaquinone biosynthesis C-methylase UbiE
VALHHFPDQAAAVRDWARVLKPDGRLVLVDNIAPDEAAAEKYINEFERLRDPSHVWMQRLAQLVTFVQMAGLVVEQTERLVKPMQFQAWMERMQVDPSRQKELHALLWNSRGPARTFLNPQETETGITFHLHEGIILARRPA